MNDCFVEAGAELQRTQVAPEADAFTFTQIAGHTGVTVTPEELFDNRLDGVYVSASSATCASGGLRGSRTTT